MSTHKFTEEDIDEMAFLHRNLAATEQQEKLEIWTN